MQKLFLFLSLKKWLVLIIVAAFGTGFYLLVRSTPSSFVPSEDMGTIFVNITLPPASTMERVMAIAAKIGQHRTYHSRSGKNNAHDGSELYRWQRAAHTAW